VALLVLGAAVLGVGAVALRARALCFVLGHRVGPGRTELVADRDGAPVPVRFSLCLRCQHRFGG
jgi:hypothetical protein